LISQHGLCTQSYLINLFVIKKNSLLIKRLFVPIKGKKKKVDNENGLNKTMDLNYKTNQC